jgi:hypothetical protein
VNDFLITQLAREHMSRLVREAELARLARAAESSDRRLRRRRRWQSPDHR